MNKEYKNLIEEIQYNFFEELEWSHQDLEELHPQIVPFLEHQEITKDFAASLQIQDLDISSM